MASPCDHSSEPSGSVKGGEFLDQLSDCQVLKDSDPYRRLCIAFLVIKVITVICLPRLGSSS
jgi:hypothetical protein